ncbi:cupredoxin domain-containing protein [Candidatus Nomurabacteria bacterium]|nr:cupredoxin domain-containing protein [Candidatus Nomurabacteria bacterium]
MKNLYIIVLVLAILGLLFFMKDGKKVEAPTNLDGVDTPNTVAPLKEETPVGDNKPVVATKEFTVTGENFSFSPSVITVKKGDKVKITFKNSEGFHDFVIDEFGAATKQTKAPATEVLEFTADKVGSFEYYCSVGTHRAMGMKGTLKVE